MELEDGWKMDGSKDGKLMVSLFFVVRTFKFMQKLRFPSSMTMHYLNEYHQTGQGVSHISSQKA